jgi:D-alanyl-D-alanine carboxypeptidase
LIAGLLCVPLIIPIMSACSGGSASGTHGQTGTSKVQGVDSRLASKLQEILDKNRELFAAGGASAAIVIPGEGLWAGASGIADPSTGDPVTRRTVFAIGSVTKTFIAALVLKLSEDGLVRLDDQLAR